MKKEALPSPPDSELSGWERRQHQKRHQIIGAAKQLFLDQGFGQVSMDAIVDAAGVSKRTLYNYYDSKEQLFVDVIQSHLESNWPVFSPEEVALPLEERLFDIGSKVLSLAMEPEPLGLYRTVIAESQRFTELAAQFYMVSSSWVMEAIATVLSEEAAKSGLRIDESFRASEHFLDLIIGTAYMRIVLGVDKPMKQKAADEHVRRSVDCFLRAYRTQ